MFVCVTLGVLVGEDVMLGVTVGVAVAVGVTSLVGVTVGVTVLVGVTDGVLLGVAVFDGVMLGVGVGEGQHPWSTGGICNGCGMEATACPMSLTIVAVIAVQLKPSYEYASSANVAFASPTATNIVPFQTMSNIVCPNIVFAFVPPLQVIPSYE